MSANDHNLGMDRKITRRDFVNGIAVASAGAIALPRWMEAQELDYPPARTGMRGDHAGSFEAAHQLRDTGTVDLACVTRTNEIFDLGVVGGGLSGLSAAYFFLKNAGRSARILIL